ncbi:putative immunoglobulin [Trypoxylus dichotomus]
MSQKIAILLISLYISAISTRQLSKRNFLDNEINSSNSDESPDQSWVKIEAKTNDIKAFPGEAIELECEASGSPQPTIQFYNHGSILSDNEVFSNEISQLPPSALVKAVARLRVIAKKSEVIFCKATGGSKTARTAIKIFVSGSKLNFLGNDVFDFDSQEVSLIREAPRITFFDTFYLENIGNTVILPCSSMGAPGADTVWLNAEEKVVDGARDKRFTVTPFGHLKIRNIEWRDMGPYTCVVRNNFGKDSITTFLYPMLAEK